jgi:nucleoside 2-deoxyribosyltransferase
MMHVRSGRLFLAGPFKALVDKSTGEMQVAERNRFEKLIETFELNGFEVYNAHRREGWGANFLTPEECTRLDLEEISRSDVFVAFPGNPASPGTHIEIGWASALGKPIVLLLEDEKEYAFLVRGLYKVANVRYVTFAVGQDFAEEVLAAVEDVCATEGSG